MDDIEYVFPSARGGVLSDMTLTAVLRRMDVKAVPHGFRSIFRVWVAEQAGYLHEVAEMELAHTVGEAGVAAYQRGDRRPHASRCPKRFCIAPLYRGRRVKVGTDRSSSRASKS